MSVTLTYIRSTSSSVTVEARHTYSSGSRAYWDYRVTGTTSWLNRGYTLLSPSTYQQYEFTSLQSSTSYEFRVRIVDGSKADLPVLGSATTSGSTTASAQPPSSPSWVSASAISKSRVDMSWGTSSGATGYHVYVDNVYKASTTSTNYSVTGLSEYTQYKFSVVAYNSAGDSGENFVHERTLDETAPSIWNVQGTSRSTEIDVTWDASDSHSGLSYFRVYRSVGGSTSYNTVNSGSARSYTMTSLTENTTYTVWVRAYDGAGNYTDSSSKTITTLSGRPSNWAWSTSKTSGGNFNLTATEWNNFQNRINEFRKWKSLSEYQYNSYGSYTETSQFTRGSSGQNYMAYQFNQCRNAINSMIDTGTTFKYSGDTVTASDLNTLRDKLNSL
ncbi:fibronectin type III domain-containing protein [Anaerobacillus sp. MEB173]|uniref:fibronectin type III domain-containing protein n=1 Tax=Anaerobacillus sp. MEB173 TaxID=3383345 RepID=UPI003F8E1C4C